MYMTMEYLRIYLLINLSLALYELIAMVLKIVNNKK